MAEESAKPELGDDAHQPARLDAGGRRPRCLGRARPPAHPPVERTALAISISRCRARLAGVCGRVVSVCVGTFVESDACQPMTARVTACTSAHSATERPALCAFAQHRFAKKVIESPRRPAHLGS